MTDQLFTVETTLSPRLQWIAKHKVKTSLNQSGCEDPWEAFFGADCAAEALLSDTRTVAWGETMDDALFELAKKNGWKMWEGA